MVAVLGEPWSSSSSGAYRYQQQQKAAGEDGAHQWRDCLQAAAAAETEVRPGIGRAQLLRNPGPPLIDRSKSIHWSFFYGFLVILIVISQVN